MKIAHINAMTAATMLLLLPACKQPETTGSVPDSAETETSVTTTLSDRDWIPAEIVLPQPQTVIQDTKIGTRTHLLQVVVEEDPKDEILKWKSALESAGYQVDDRMLFDGRLLFKNSEIEGGQISISKADDQKGYVIQIDVRNISR